jgi:hypothetical protein
MQEDPIGIAGGANLYAYSGNNPVAYTDPFGLCPEQMAKNEAECEKWNQSQIKQAVALYNQQAASGNQGARTPLTTPVRGVSEGNLHSPSNCGIQTNTGCTRGRVVNDRVNASGIVLNADRSVPAIAATLAHETVHAAGATDAWEGLAEAMNYLFVQGLPLTQSLQAIHDRHPAGLRPWDPVVPWSIFPVTR